MTAAPNPASAPASTPGGAAGSAGLLVMRGPALGFVGISCLGWGLGRHAADGTRSDAGECHIPGESRALHPPESSVGKGEGGWEAGWPLARTGSP